MGTIKGEASAEIEAPIARVWEIVEDVASAPEWQDGLDTMEVLERDGDGHGVLVRSETDATVRKIKSVIRFSYEGPTLLSWEQEKGDLKWVKGSWRLEELDPGRTRATYALEVDPGRMLGMLIRGPVEGQVRKLLVESRPGELKVAAEG